MQPFLYPKEVGFPMDGFTSIHNSFIVDTRFTMAEKMILIWLASKPADWQVREDQIMKELGIGRDMTRRLLRELRAKGAVTKPKPERTAAGTWAKLPSYLAMRDEVRHVSAGGTRWQKPATVEPASGEPAHTTKENELKIVKPTTGEASAEPIVSYYEDKSLADLVSNAPCVRAIEALWRVHKTDGEWTPEITELAKARKAELASAEV